MELQLDSAGVQVRAVLAQPPVGAAPSRGLVICHGTPGGQHPLAADVSASYAELAANLASASGWSVLSLDFRQPAPVGPATPLGWLTDLRAAVAHMAALDGVSGVWLAGFSIGGALSICVGGEDETLRGVAAFASPAELDDWVDEPREARPLQSVGKLPPRPVLLVHGDADDVVSVTDARALADAAGPEVELRILAGAGHGLRNDPRALAVLEGWLDRQEG